MSDYKLKPFVDVHPTKLDLDPLNLLAIDLSLFKEGEENLAQRLELAKVLESSITTYGFFNLINFGVSPETVEHIRSISQAVLTLPEEVKLKYLASAATKEQETSDTIGGERGRGFKPRGYWAIKDGVRDSIDLYNVRSTYHDEFLQHPERHPDVLQYYLEDISEYFNFIHRNVLPKLLRLCDLILRVPEGTILEKYFENYATNEDDSGSHGRLMLYNPYENSQDSSKSENTYLRGHSDISALTFITSQPMLSLQIKDVYTGDWRYVNHCPNSLIVNIGDALEFISGGYFRACLHRVIEPPADQVGFKRLVVIYFCNPNNGCELDPELLKSEKLASLGYSKEDKLNEWEKIHFVDWNDTKGKLLGRSDVGERNLLKVYGRLIERWHVSTR